MDRVGTYWCKGISRQQGREVQDAGRWLDEEAFVKLSGTVSLHFPAGGHNRIAIKVIDPRGNEVLRVHKLGVYQGSEGGRNS